jgi:hypothetical protein
MAPGAPVEAQKQANSSAFVFKNQFAPRFRFTQAVLLTGSHVPAQQWQRASV